MKPDLPPLPDQARGFHEEGMYYWHVEHHTGRFPDLEVLLDAGNLSELAREIGRRAFLPGTTFEDLLR